MFVIICYGCKVNQSKDFEQIRLQNPNYGTGSGFSPNDIAVVVASSAISGTNIENGVMASDSANPGGNAFITGWGRTCGKY